MKKKIFSLLALVMTAMTASAIDVPTYALTEGENEHGTMTFKVGETTVTSAKEGDVVTVIIEPETGYVPGTPTGVWHAAVAASRRVAAAAEFDFMDSVIVFAPVSGKDNQWTFRMERAAAKVSVVYKRQIQASWVQNIEALTYNGSEQKPDVTVKDGDKTLELDKDYTVAYSNNVNAGTATVTITGIGDFYTGTVTKTFTIDKATDGVRYDPWRFTKNYGDPNFTILPENKAGGTLTYKSSNTDVATIDANTGEVTIKGVGEATIYAILAETANYINGSDWYKLKVVMAKLTLDETTVNGEALDGADGKWYDVTLTRSLKAGMWNTFAVPFAVDAETLTAMGITAKELTGSSFANGTLTLNFGDATSLEAGKPYLVKASETLTNPTFSKVKVSKTAVPTVTSAVDFVPTLGKTEIAADDAKSVLFLTSGNKLQYPASLPADFKGFRAYFLLKGDAVTARQFQLNIDGETTGISHTEITEITEKAGAVYDLNGRRIAAPTKKGVYVKDGRKVVVK